MESECKKLRVAVRAYTACMHAWLSANPWVKKLVVLYGKVHLICWRMLTKKFDLVHQIVSRERVGTGEETTRRDMQSISVLVSYVYIHVMGSLNCNNVLPTTTREKILASRNVPYSAPEQVSQLLKIFIESFLSSKREWNAYHLLLKGIDLIKKVIFLHTVDLEIFVVKIFSWFA